jgi:hypothetical protein
MMEVSVVSSWKRIIIAAFVSVLGCTLTYVWHVKNEPKSQRDSEADVIAYITKTKREIHRKGANNTLWEPAEELDRLRAGDSVRTSSNSETRIQFYRSNRYIDLEADSMIVIQKQESEISLELLEGSLFVNGVDKGNKGSLTLKSQGGKVDLSKSAAQLSGSSNAKVDLKVLKGSAQFMKEGGGKSEAIQEGKEGGIGNAGLKVTTEKVKLLYPDTTKPYFINAKSPDPVRIHWSGLPADAQVFLESGPSRKNLARTATEKLAADQLQVMWKPGTYYWKLKALNPTTQKAVGESPVFKSEIVGRFPPTPVTPEPNFNLQTRRAAENVTLRWTTSEDYKDVLVELQNDASKQIIVNSRVPASIDFKDVPNLALGSYSWKLTAYPKDGGQPLVGTPHQFSINEKRTIKIPINWNANLPLTQYFVGAEPKLTLMWDPDQTERVIKWKVRYASEGTDLTKAEGTDVRQQIKFERTVPKAGRYSAFIEAFDEEGEVIGTSEIRTFNVALLPLLTAPNLDPSSGPEYLARPDGSMIIIWEEIPGAKEYQIFVSDKNGQVLSEFTTEAPNYKLNNLMPGTYSVQVGATDSHGRRGELSGKRSLIVPDKSAVEAPNLRKIKVNETETAERRI